MLTKTWRFLYLALAKLMVSADIVSWIEPLVGALVSLAAAGYPTNGWRLGRGRDGEGLPEARASRSGRGHGAA